MPPFKSSSCQYIAAEQPFIDTLAHWLLECFGHDPALLTRVLVLLPTRRACRSLREAFLRATQGKPLLLPRMLPLGEAEEAEDMLAGMQAAELKPAIPAMRRLLHLTRLVDRFRSRQDARQASATTAQSAELARQLAHFLDETERFGIDLKKLETLPPEEYSQHWQQTLEFLSIISAQWPLILEHEGMLDPAQRQKQALERLAASWQESPPDHPIVAAGMNAASPAATKLLSVIARLPQGTVILPGLDTAMPESQWRALTPTHPQYGMMRLLETLECLRENITPLAPHQHHASEKRLELWRSVLNPAEATAQWQEADPALLQGLGGMRLIEADTQADEARLIAISLREVLDTPGKTAALVTPDRQLARMVAAQMARFGITLDDSAGSPLSQSPPAVFLRLCLDMALSFAAPVPLLALLRHPLAGCGMNTAECRQLSRRLELHALRGLRHEPGIAQLRLRSSDTPELMPLLDTLAACMQPLEDCFRERSVDLAHVLEMHIACAEQLAATDTQPGAERLWAGDDGQALAAFIAELRAHACGYGEIDPQAYPAFLLTLMAGEVLRPAYGLHPRLHILGPIEARLQRFDRVILAGLNEGTWPADAGADPWLSRPMRSKLGLPPADEAVGQSAHDIYLQAATPELWLSRARKTEGSPSVASRWLVRLQTLCEGLDKQAWARFSDTSWQHQALAGLDRPVHAQTITRPAYAPPAQARPDSLSVTKIDLWLADPYEFYARTVLKLAPLPPLDEEPEAADFGIMVHRTLERFAKEWPDSLPDDMENALLACAHSAFAPVMERPAVACLWWPRLVSAMRWLAEEEKKRRGTLAMLWPEVNGRWEFSISGHPFTLTTRIDRLEQNKDGRIVIADYKTGSPPDASAVEKGLANQLPLEALIARFGQLSRPLPEGAQVAGLEYWKLSGNPKDCFILPLEQKMKAGLETCLQQARNRLEALVVQYANPAQPYTATGDGSRDMAHFIRKQEWDPV